MERGLRMSLLDPTRSSLDTKYPRKTASSVEAARASPIANLLAGGAGGLLSLVVGHPFDTVKVRLQTGSGAHSGAVDCLTHLVRNEGFSGLFRGMGGLVLFALPRFSLLFYSNCLGRSLVRQEGQPLEELTVTQIVFGGAFSQLLIAPTLVAPIERVKVLLQTSPGLYSGQVQCLRAILRQEGWRGLTKGSGLTLLRDVPGFVTFFMVYEQLRMSLSGGDSLDLSTTAAIGAVAGICAWAVAIPADNLKSRIQAGVGVPLRLSGLYTGAGVILLRAGPANAATFVGYEWALRAYTGLGEGHR